MGLKDTVTTKYMRQNKIFADLFNYFIYSGEQVIDPGSLEELDTREVDVPYGGKEGARQPVQRTRDVIKSVIAMKDRRTAYLLLAVEAQSNIHNAMPVKNMVYDALQYAGGRNLRLYEDGQGKGTVRVPRDLQAPDP